MGMWDIIAHGAPLLKKRRGKKRGGRRKPIRRKSSRPSITKGIKTVGQEAKQFGHNVKAGIKKGYDEEAAKGATTRRWKKYLKEHPEQADYRKVRG